MNVLTIAHLTFHEARRRKVVAAGLALGVAFLVLFAVAFNFIYGELQSARPSVGPVFSSGSTPQQRQQGMQIFVEFIVMAGLYAVNFLVVMMTILTPVDTLSGEIASGAIQSLVTKPVRRSEIVIGKWLGFWLLAMGYLALMAGGVLVVARVIGNFSLQNVPLGLALIALEGTVLLTVSIAGGSRLSTLANGVMGFGLFGLAFIGSWIEQIGALVGNQTAQNIGIVSSLILPSESLWRMASHNMQSFLVRELGITPFASFSVPSPAMAAYAVVYVAGVFAFGLWQFSRRDL